MKRPIIVIADDITGAAEIAGIALKHGLQTVLTTAAEAARADVTVISTDTRSGSESEARQVMRQIAERLAEGKSIAEAEGMAEGKNTAEAEGMAAGKRLPAGGCLIFKKTDSVLRGHVAAELQTLIEACGFEGALLVPQNPSKGRIIRNGQYYINNVPLHETDFRFDPEFPATTSIAAQLLARGCHCPEISIADATSAEEIQRHLADIDYARTLLAGGADLFTALLNTLSCTADAQCDSNVDALTKSGKQGAESVESVESIESVGSPEGLSGTACLPAIFLCGSTQSKSLADEPFIRVLGAAECVMPQAVFDGGDPTAWLAELQQTYIERRAIIVSVGDKPNGGPACAVRLRSLMAAATKHLAAAVTPHLLVIEGGATAFATLHRLNWHTFALKQQYAPGVVGMTHSTCQHSNTTINAANNATNNVTNNAVCDTIRDTTHVTTDNAASTTTEVILKPGSYPWGSLFN